MHWAVYEGQVSAVQFMLEKMMNNARLSLNGWYDSGGDVDFEGIVEAPPLSAICFSLALAVSQRNAKMLDYLLNQYSADSSIIAFPFWNSEHLSFVLRGTF